MWGFGDCRGFRDLGVQESWVREQFEVFGGLGVWEFAVLEFWGLGALGLECRAIVLQQP